MFLTDKNIIVLSEVDSTNNYAKQLLAQKATQGTVVLAHYQHSGRGQVGNSWESERGKNLLFSLILKPDFLMAAQQFYISKIVSLALVKVLSQYLKGVIIKWPNDIYVGEQKIAGMLIENWVKGNNLESSVVGVGLNVNQEKFLSGAPNPVSLKQLLNEELDITAILKEFLLQLDEYLHVLNRGLFDEIDEEYCKNLFRNSGWHRYKKGATEFEAKITGIGSFGQLRLEKRDGTLSEFMFKEVEFVL
ncbi:biotin--[acetyl-CoA-carboxylase] ligase [uncultured Draconibacterium sp.]|uniref:biotin--[acetyl-CoA-carboxylase] ligase n=1 Tax=uncultured Draconibacterium sp. TaxID=1573823 RepID=UPI00326148F2